MFIQNDKNRNENDDNNHIKSDVIPTWYDRAIMFIMVWINK